MMQITIDKLQKAFGATVVCDHIDLDIRSGELLALLGPSGSGKTSLLRMIAGLELADAGRILFNGHDITALDARRRNIGFVFQHYALFPHMTVADNVAFGLSIQPAHMRPSRAEIRHRTEDLLHKVQLAGLGQRYPHQLSGGQRQRVALARALATQPQVLLLDEPFGALDAKVRKELRRWLRHIHHEMGVTSIFVTHDQEEALEVADRIVVMNAGRIEQVGTPEQVYQQPASPFVMEFLGETNRLPHHSSSAVQYVRPHQFRIEQQEVEGAIPVYWLNSQAIGAHTYLEFALRDADDGAEPIQVQLPQAEYQRLTTQAAFMPHQLYWLHPQHTHIFPAAAL